MSGDANADDGLTLSGYVYSTYNSLLKNDWKMNDIDSMDMLGFLRIRAWDAQQRAKKEQPRPAYIDQVWPNLR